MNSVKHIGNHRVLCGDSTNPEDVAALMGGKKARILFTSPPYLDLRVYGIVEENLSLTHVSSFIGAYRAYTDYMAVNLGIVRKDGEILRYWDTFIDEAYRNGLKLLAWNVWARNNAGSIGKQIAMFPIYHEFVFVFGTKPYDLNKTVPKSAEANLEHNQKRPRGVKCKDGSFRFCPKGDQSSLYKKLPSVLNLHAENHFPKGMSHPAAFPVEFAEEYIKAMTDEGDIVIDPFGGSGSTLLACERTNRICYTMELNQEYCDLMEERFSNEKAKQLRMENEW